MKFISILNTNQYAYTKVFDKYCNIKKIKQHFLILRTNIFGK